MEWTKCWTRSSDVIEPEQLTIFPHNINTEYTQMLRNIDRRSERVESHENVERADLDYDDGEVVLIALCEEVDESFEEFVENLGLTIRSGPKWVGLGVEVILA